jgi:ABC-type proline/glycine betaine transport system permease subunit
MREEEKILSLYENVKGVDRHTEALEESQAQYSQLKKQRISVLKSNTDVFMHTINVSIFVNIITSFVSLVLGIPLSYLILKDIPFVSKYFTAFNIIDSIVPIFISTIFTLIIAWFYRTTRKNDLKHPLFLGFEGVYLYAFGYLLLGCLYFIISFVFYAISFFQSIFNKPTLIEKPFIPSYYQVIRVSFLTGAGVLTMLIVLFLLSIVIIYLYVFFSKNIIGLYFKAKSSLNETLSQTKSSIEFHQKELARHQKLVNESDVLVEKYKTRFIINRTVHYMKTQKYAYFVSLNQAIFDQQHNDYLAQINAYKKMYEDRYNQANSEIDEMNLRLKVREEVYSDERKRIQAQYINANDKNKYNN